MPRLKSVTDANGTKIYPITITRGVYDTDKNQRLNVTLANKAENTVMGASGSTHAPGLVPDTPSTAGTEKYLREDGTWQKPPNDQYESKQASSGGTDVSLVTTGEKYTWNSKTSNTGTVTKVTAGTGLTGGDITTTGTIALATSGVTAGTYKRVTVDAYGRVTSGDNTDSDTKNTAGTTNKTGTKMFLAAATEQSANPVTYSNSNCYIGTDNCLYSGGTKVLTAHQNISGKVDKTTTVNGHALSSNVTVTKSDVGLGNVTNDAQVKRSEMGAASGVATLDSNGKVLSSQLPSYVDDVIEGYFYNSKFYKESEHTTEITGETGKIYVDLSTNKTYRWGGSSYAVISETLALGETSSTAYRGDRGKTAYTHSQTTSGNPHNVTKSDVGLGNVGNFKAVSTVASQGLSDTEKANARTNIGAGTSSFSGSYNDLSNKPTIPAAAANGTYTVKTLVGSTTTNVSDFTANQSSADDVTFVQGSNVTITPDTTNRKITIAAKDTTYGVVSTSANGLAPKVTDTSKFLKGDGTWATPTDTNNRRSFYGTCDTAAATAAKVVTLSDTSGWELKAGTIVGIKFTNTNTASNVTLNVNSSGAKSIWYNDAAYTGNSNAICGYASRVTYYMYDGTQWVWLNMGSLDGNTDTKVAQTVTTTSADYEVLFSNTADNTTRTEGARKNSNLKFNPSTGNLQATQLNGVTIGSSPKFTDTTYSSKAAASGGTDVSLVTTGEKAIWNAKTSNTGTITGIKMNGASKGTSGVVDLGTVITSLNHTVTVQSGLKSDGTTTISGTSSSAGSPTVALGDSGVTAGTYKRVTVNAKGIVIEGDNSDSDTKNTAGTTNKTGTKMFLAAATEQSANPVTYSNSNCYIGTDNCLYSGGSKVLTSYTEQYTGTVTGVKVGTTSYSPSSGIVTIPAYPTTLPASDVSSWAKASSKPSYAYSEIGYSVNAISSAGGSVSLDGTTPLHIVTLTGNVSALTLSANPPVGHSCHVIFTCGSTSYTVTIAHSNTMVTYNNADAQFTVPANGYVEVDFLYAADKIFVRGV